MGASVQMLLARRALTFWALGRLSCLLPSTASAFCFTLLSRSLSGELLLGNVEELSSVSLPVTFIRGCSGSSGSGLVSCSRFHVIGRLKALLVLSWNGLWFVCVFPLDFSVHRVGSILFCSADCQFSHLVVSDSLWACESQHTRPPCLSPTPRVYPNPCPLSRWCHPAILSSVVPFSSCPQSLTSSGSFPMSQVFAWGGQSIGVSALASFLPMNTQDWSPLGWTGWTSLQSKGLSRVFSNTTVQKHQFFGTQLLHSIIGNQYILMID